MTKKYRYALNLFADAMQEGRFLSFDHCLREALAFFDGVASPAQSQASQPAKAKKKPLFRKER
jgi:hypothetical protein